MAAIRRGCPKQQDQELSPSLRRRARSFPQARQRQAVRLIVACTQQARSLRTRPANGPTESPSPTSARRRAGRATARKRAQKWRPCLQQRPSPRRTIRSSPSSSDGVILIYGRDEAAIEAGQLLRRPPRRHGHAEPAAVTPTPPAATVFPIVKGTIRNGQGHFGAFELTIDDLRRAPALLARSLRASRRHAAA